MFERGEPVSARGRVHRLLASQIKRFPDLEIAELDTRGLDPRDAALAHHIYDTVLRRWLTIQHLLSMSLELPWEKLHPRVAAPLMVAAAQIVFFDRIPLHAAVDEAVRASKGAGPRSGGLCNAVLRGLVRTLGGDDAGNAFPSEKRPTWNAGWNEVPSSEGGAIGFKVDVLPKDPMTALSIGTSHAIEILRLWSKHFPLAEVKRLAWHGLAVPPVILNTAHAKSTLPEGSVAAHAVPGHSVWTGSHDDLARMLEERPDVWVQDPASSLAVSSVADLRPKVVVDACAGMGTKTRQLRATFPEARVVATDIDAVRLGALKDAMKGTGVEVVEYPKLQELAGQADLVLLDVPCSNTGVLARRLEARYRFDRARSERLVSMQKQIIADAIPLLRHSGGGVARGAILYSTCSLDPAENQEQVRWAAKWHMFKVAREHTRTPQGGPGEAATSYTDGSYAALLS